MNNNLISLGTLVLSVFVAGSYFGSGNRERDELRKEIEALKASQAQVLAEVQQANKDYQEKQKKFNEETLVLNQKLVSLSAQKQAGTKAIAANKIKVEQTKQGIEIDLSNLSQYIAINPLKIDSTNQAFK